VGQRTAALFCDATVCVPKIDMALLEPAVASAVTLCWDAVCRPDRRIRIVRSHTWSSFSVSGRCCCMSAVTTVCRRVASQNWARPACTAFPISLIVSVCEGEDTA